MDEIIRSINGATFKSDEGEDAVPYHLNLSLYPGDLPEPPPQSIILRNAPPK